VTATNAVGTGSPSALSNSVTPTSYKLTVTIASNPPNKGGGSVNSDAGISCAGGPGGTSGTCTADFTPGTSVTLYQTPDSNSTWATWSVSSCGTNQKCQVTMNAAQNVTATFAYSNMARVNSTGNGYDSLTLAYGNTGTTDTIYSRAVNFTENLTLSGNKAVTLLGGRDAWYQPQNAWTTLQGGLTIQNGSLTVDNLVIEQVGATAPPFIEAYLYSLTTGTNPFGYLQLVNVYTDNTHTTPITGSTVTVAVNNGTPQNLNPVNANSGTYVGNISVAPGAAVTLSVNIGGNIFTATGTQFSTFPTATYIPQSMAGMPITVNWDSVAPAIPPTGGMTYAVGLVDSNGQTVYPVNHEPYLTSTTSYTFTPPASFIGTYQLFVGIASQGIGTNTGGISIPNAASGSGLWLGGIKAFVPVSINIL
jgi:hypothetical protein